MSRRTRTVRTVYLPADTAWFLVRQKRAGQQKKAVGRGSEGEGHVIHELQEDEESYWSEIVCSKRKEAVNTSQNLMCGALSVSLVKSTLRGNCV